jgi:hypothetical protein
LLGSTFCIAADAQYCFFLTARHNFHRPESSYVDGTSRLLIGARPLRGKRQVYSLLEVTYRGSFGSPSKMTLA